MTASPRVLVVGGVAAGMSAASQVRRRLPSAEVVVFERGPYISYGACGIPYNIEDLERSMDDLVVLTAEQARAERGIDLRLLHEVRGIDLARQLVTVHDAGTDREAHESFDALVLAMGARAVRPPLPGAQLPGVFVLRELTDGERLKSELEGPVRKVAIVGAGYIGLEMAHVLTARGLEVTLLEKMPQILPGWHVDTVTTVLETLTRRGVDVRTGVAVAGLEAGTDGRVATISTGDGPIASDLVLLAVGVRPNVSVALDAGLKVGDTGALWVNQFQQTSHPQVWAAGDCAEAYHRVLRRNAWIPLGTTANKQGRIAGANASGANERFRGIVGTAGFVTFDLEVARSGLSLEQARAEGFDAVTVTIRQRSRAHAFPDGATVQVHLVADRPTGLLLGGELVGREGAALRVNVLASALATHLTVADLQGLDLVYAPPFAPVWDPLLVAANQLAKKLGRNA